mgnify:CR=1 FL=1
MAKALKTLEAKREAARAEAKAKLEKAIAPFGHEPEEPTEDEEAAGWGSGPFI